MDFPSKCYVVVFHNLELVRIHGKNQYVESRDLFYCKEASDAVSKLQDILKQIPKFVLVITRESADQYGSQIKSEDIPWILSGGGPVMSLGRRLL